MTQKNSNETTEFLISQNDISEEKKLDVCGVNSKGLIVMKDGDMEVFLANPKEILATMIYDTCLKSESTTITYGTAEIMGKHLYNLIKDFSFIDEIYIACSDDSELSDVGSDAEDVIEDDNNSDDVVVVID